MHPNKYLGFFLANLVFIIFFSWLMPAHALIVTSDNINDIVKYADKGTLVVFDLDNTLIKNNQTLGSDQWFYAYFKKLKSEGHTDANSLAKTVQIYTEAQKKSKASLVEPVASKIVADLQKMNPNVMALTTRGFVLKDTTISQLNSVDIDFNKGFGKHKFFTLTPPINSAKFYHGIAFSDDNDKGSCLLDIIEKENLKFNKIVFIDDKIKNVKSIDKAAKEKGIEYVGIRYSHLDSEAGNLDTEVASIQQEFLEKIISDEEARVIANHRKKKLM